MYTCHEDVLAYHDEKVTLPEKERGEMRERRDTNRKRLIDGLKRDKEPAPIGCYSQGSYAMRTMVQHPEKDYDIDDGAYFEKDDLVGPRGGDRTAGDAKEMARKAIHDDKFNKPPEVRTNCVRVYYNAGYHVDVPIYRKVTQKNAFGQEETWYELASTEWKRSDPLAVTEWFKLENQRQSPDGNNNGGQLRRITRFLKALARSRESWRPRIASGFIITKLITECYRGNGTREDRALYDTMVAVRDRLRADLEVEHPVLDEMLTAGPDDASTRFLRDKLDWAIAELRVLFEPACTREQALKAWDKVFNTDFFSGRLVKAATAADRATAGQGAGAAAAAVGIAAAGLTAAILTNRAKAEPRHPDRPVEKRGGGRYA